MYVVIELQTYPDGNVGNMVSVHPTRNEAEQKYHLILSAAAVSTVPIHSAVMLEDTGYLIKNECYDHREQNPEE